MKICIVFGFFLVLWGCDIQPSRPIDIYEKTNLIYGQNFPLPHFNYDSVMMELFDGVKVVDSFVYWKPNFQERMSFTPEDSDFCKTRLWKIFHYTDNYYLLIFQTGKHIGYEKNDGPPLSAALFFDVNGEWIMNGYGFNKYVGAFGNYGTLQDSDIVLEPFGANYLLRVNQYESNNTGVRFRTDFFNILDRFKTVFTYFPFSGEWGDPSRMDTCELIHVPESRSDPIGYGDIELRIKHNEYESRDEILERPKTVGIDTKLYIYDRYLDKYVEQCK